MAVTPVIFISPNPCADYPPPDPDFVGPPTPVPSTRCSPSTRATDIFSLCQTSPSPNIYCCPTPDGNFIENGDFGMSFVNGVGCPDFSFNNVNDDLAPMLKSALNGTAISPWVRIAFQQYFPDGTPDGDGTNATVITVGNESQLTTLDPCSAIIKSFQYGWGTINAGNRCRITIIDERGNAFNEWVTNLVVNTESASKPLIGVYKMKVQFGWYVSGGGPNDICGQAAADPDSGPPVAGTNTSYTICSPTLWFLPDMISVHWEGGKFVYELEGIDLLFRGQESVLAKGNGGDGSDLTDPFSKGMFFTEAVTLLGRQSFPPFRVRFLAKDNNGAITSMKFYPSQSQHTNFDPCLGPFNKWMPYERSPIAVVQAWLNTFGIIAEDLTGTVAGKKCGITINYDPTQNLTNGPVTPAPSLWYTTNCETCIQGRTQSVGCLSNLPDYGTMILWTNSVPLCQSVLTDAQINTRLKAVYVINGGNCSPVLSFNPVIRWQFYAGLKAGGTVVPWNGKQTKQIEGLFDSNCAVAGGRGIARSVAVVASALAGIVAGTVAVDGIQQAIQLHQVANLTTFSIEAEMRVQGDPSFWLCTPYGGYGRCVGIIFVNPIYLNQSDGQDCPQFQRLSADSVCNTTLTNKGWFIKGVDHQIRDGSYTTTLKLFLPAPGAEINFNTPNVPPTSSLTLSASDPTGAGALGAWVYGLPVDWGQTFASVLGYALGSQAATGLQNQDSPGVIDYQGGGPICLSNGTPCSWNECTDDSCDT